LRALRANRIFCTDKKRIRTENTVLGKSIFGFGLSLCKIAECVRMTLINPRGRAAGRASAISVAKANRVALA